MALAAKYQWTFHGRRRTWTVQILQEGFGGSVTLMKAGAEMRATWGRRTNTFDNRRRGMELRVEVLDPSLTLYNDLIDADYSEDDYQLYAVDSTGTYTLRARIRLDEVSTDLIDGLRQQVTTIYCYCGLAELENIDALTLTSATFNDIFVNILSSASIEQNIEYYSAHYAENAAASGALMDLHRLNRLDLIFAEEGRKVDTMADQLDSMLQGLQLTAWNGLDGQWHIKNEFSIGTEKTDRGAQRYTAASSSISTLNTLSANLLSLTNSIAGRQMRRRPIKPVQAVQVERGNDRSFFSVDVVKHGDFEAGWVSATEHEVWDVVEGSYLRSTNADTGTYAFQLPDGSNRADQTLLRFAGGGQDIDIEFAVRYALESTSASTSKSGTAFIELQYTNPTTLDLEKGNGGGVWGFAGAFTLSSGIVASGSALQYATLVTTVYGPLPDFDGNLKVSIQGALNNFKSYIDTLEVRLKKGDEATASFRSVAGRYNLTGDLIGKGDVIKQRVPWFNGLFGTDVAEDGTRDEVIPMLQAYTGGAWVQASQFRSFAGGFESLEYDDPFELVAGVRIVQQGENREEISGQILDIVPHEKAVQYASKMYSQVFTDIDFRREVTETVAHENAGVNPIIADPEVLYLALEDGYGYADITDSTPWSYAQYATPVSGREVDSIRADVPAGILWALEYSTADSNNKFLTRRSLSTGALVSTPLSWNGSGTTAQVFAIHRANERIYVAVKNTSTLVAGVYEYDYAGNLLRTIFTPAAGNITGLCVSPNGSNLYFRHKKTGLGPFDRLYRATLIDGSSSIITGSFTYGQASGVSLDQGAVDEEGGIFINAFTNLVSFPYPAGGSETVVTTSPAHNGLAIDRYNRWLYWAGALQYQVSRCGYDGTGGGLVMDEGAGNEFQSMCIGYD